MVEPKDSQIFKLTTAKMDALRRVGRASNSIETTKRIAGDLRHPLHSLRELFESLLRQGQIAPAGLQNANSIRLQLSRLEQIIDAYSKPVLLTVRTPILKAIDLCTIANESLLMLASSVPEGTHLELRQADGLLPAFADAAQISQVVFTLALHALDTAGKTGRVVITTGRSRTATQVFLEVSQSRVLIDVSHDGPALSGDVRQQLFDLSDTESSMGLHIAKRILDMHGGDLLVESPRLDIGCGMRLTAFLPELREYQI